MQGLPLARLSGTRTEADQIVKLARERRGAQPDVWLNLDASEENIDNRDITKYRVVHIATHGLLNAERPQFTGLGAVARRQQGSRRLPQNRRSLQSPARAHRWSCFRLAKLAWAKRSVGEGVIGLTRAFMYAGAPTVGVSLWSVADKSTADLMTDFYKRLLTAGSTESSPSGAHARSAAPR